MGIRGVTVRKICSRFLFAILSEERSEFFPETRGAVVRHAEYKSASSFEETYFHLQRARDVRKNMPEDVTALVSTSGR
ncbi:hypothetical protein MHYP_G00131440 [Metynnis hypsauchen]